jgi:mRNA degradation ribonuclease J1/J2
MSSWIQQSVHVNKPNKISTKRWMKIGNRGESLLVTDSGENSHRQEQKDDRHRYRDIYTIFANTHVISYKYR